MRQEPGAQEGSLISSQNGRARASSWRCVEACLSESGVQCELSGVTHSGPVYAVPRGPSADAGPIVELRAGPEDSPVLMGGITQRRGSQSLVPALSSNVTYPRTRLHISIRRLPRELRLSTCARLVGIVLGLVRSRFLEIFWNGGLEFCVS